MPRRNIWCHILHCVSEGGFGRIFDMVFILGAKQFVGRIHQKGRIEANTDARNSFKERTETGRAPASTISPKLKKLLI